MQGRILKATGGFYYVLSGTVLYECRARGLFRKNGVSPLVGDWVDMEVIWEDEDTLLINGQRVELSP